MLVPQWIQKIFNWASTNLIKINQKPNEILSETHLTFWWIFFKPNNILLKNI